MDNLLTTLEEEICSAVKACLNRYKIDLSADPNLQYDIQLVQYFLNLESFSYLRKCKNGKIPALAN